MKKLFTLALSLALCASVYADSTKMLTLGMGTPSFDEPQLMGLGISPNGKYVCGSIEGGAGYFILNWENNDFSFDVTDDDEGAELRHVDNNGLAIGYNGPGVTYSIDGVETVIPTPEGDYKYVLGEDLTVDGSMMVGSLVGASFNTKAAYCKDGGEWIELPFPTAEQLCGLDVREVSTAKFVSGDGKVILGALGGIVLPVIWVLNDKGEYEVDVFLFDRWRRNCHSHS